MAASLLRAIQLPELIVQTPSQYEELAVEMANDTRRLRDIRRRLVKIQQRVGTPDNPTCTLEELHRFLWRHSKEEYLKMVDAGNFAMRYFIPQFEREDAECFDGSSKADRSR